MWKIQSILSVVLLHLHYNNAQGFNISDAYTNAPTPDTREPTVRPSSLPTMTPSAYPTVADVNDENLIVISARVPVTAVTLTDVEDEQDYFEALLGDAFELDLNEVDIKLRRAETNEEIKDYCNKTGIDIIYEVISDDTETYTYARSSVATGFFATTFNEGLENVYSENSFVCFITTDTTDTPIVEGFTLEEYDSVYTPAPDPTFTEQVWNEYLFFGFATSLIGVVWLWYLRTEVGDEGIYVNNNGNKNNYSTKQTSNDNGPPQGTRMPTNTASQGGDSGNNIEMQGVPKGSSNALLEDDGTTKNTGGRLSDYAVKNDDGKLVLDQRDSNRSP